MVGHADYLCEQRDHAGRTSHRGHQHNFGDVANDPHSDIAQQRQTKTKICQVDKGVVKGQGSTSALGVEFDMLNCQVSQSDVTLIPLSPMNTSACAESRPIPGFSGSAAICRRAGWSHGKDGMIFHYESGAAIITPWY